MVAMNYNDALKAVQAGGTGDVKDLDELRDGLSSMHLYYANYRDPSIKAAIESFEFEIARRNQQEHLRRLHESEMKQGMDNHGKTMDEMGKLKASVDLVKASVDRLAGARWIDWAILIAGVVAAIAAVILLFR